MTEFVSQTQPDGSSRLVVDGDITIYDALDIKQHLLAAIMKNDKLELDLSQVSTMDTAGCQLLIMAKRESQRQGKAFHIAAMSESAQEIIDFYNLGAYLGAVTTSLEEIA